MERRPWKDVRPGSTVLVKGEPWKVTERAGQVVTMEHKLLGTRTGQPPADTLVQVTDEPRVISKVSRSDMQRMAKDNETTVDEVEAVFVQVSLGGSFIANIADEPDAVAQAPYVEVMDVQMLRNHLAAFHGEYPADIRLEHLVALHEDLAATEPHQHTVSF